MRIFFLVCTLILQSQLMASDLFREHKLSEEAFQEKTREVYQAGLAVINEESTSSADAQHKIPLMTHTFLSTKKTAGAALLSEDQKQWFATSIDALPEWQHILWVTEDPTSISPEDLGNLAGRVEVRSIDAFSLPCVAEINKLLEFGLNKHASAMFRYAVLAKQGGVVRDLDTEIMQDLTPLNSMFLFYAGFDLFQRIDSRFIASMPGHPVIRKALDLVKIHASKSAGSLPLKKAMLESGELVDDYYTKYANGPLSVSFQQWGEIKRDMIFNRDFVSSFGTASTSSTHVIHYAAEDISEQSVGRTNFVLSEDSLITLDTDVLKKLDIYRSEYMDGGKYTSEQILQDFLSQPLGITSRKRSTEVIFSLTSFPPRMPYTWLSIESLLRQTELPDRVVLNLYEGEFPDRALPWFIQQQIKRGLEINWCPKNFKVGLKVIPTIQKYTQAISIAVDDDIIYPKEKLQDLMSGYRKHPNCVIAQEVREMTHLGEDIFPCCDWNFTGWNGFVDERELGPSKFLVPEGVTGVLFPPESLHEIVNDFDKFTELTPTEDDLWLYSALILNGKSVVKIPSSKLPHVIEDAHNMESALSKTNTANGYQVSTQSFHNLFHSLNLGNALSVERFNKSTKDAKKNAAEFLSYGTFLTPRHYQSPIALMNGFSWTEQWIGHRGGVWTDSNSSSFAIVVPQTGYSTVNIKSRFCHHPENHNFINFRIKRDGYTILRGEFDTEWFDFSFVDSFESLRQEYEILIDNPIIARECGHDDYRNLGILVHKVKVDPGHALSFNRSEELIVNIDPSRKLLREGAANIAFDYALYQCGIDEQTLKANFSSVLLNSYRTTIAKQLLPTPSIPFLHHRAWHTSEKTPRQIPDHILEKYINSMKVMHAANESWQNIFWCNKKDLIQPTISKLTDACPWVEVREVKDLPNFIGKKYYDLLMSDNRYTNANDIFRLSLIHAMGGIYLDLGFEVKNDISCWLHTYDGIVSMYSTGAIDHHVLGMAPLNKFTESYLRRLQNPESISKKLISKWSSEPYFQQHLFFGASGFLVDILERATEADKFLLVPEENPFIKRNAMQSWFSGNSFGNTPVERSTINMFNM